MRAGVRWAARLADMAVRERPEMLGTNRGVGPEAGRRGTKTRHPRVRE